MKVTSGATGGLRDAPHVVGRTLVLTRSQVAVGSARPRLLAR
jgi:hypothetical protein